MDKESLKIARKIIIEGLDKNGNKIKPQDRAELIMNLWLLLDEDNYEHDIDVLRRYGKPNNDNQKRR